MTQQCIEIVQFLEGANLTNLDLDLDAAPGVMAHVGGDVPWRPTCIYVNNPTPQALELVRKEVESHGYRFKTQFPSGYVKIKFEENSKVRKHDRGKLEREMKSLTKLKRPLEGDILYVQVGNLDDARNIISEAGFRIKRV